MSCITLNNMGMLRPALKTPCITVWLNVKIGLPSHTSYNWKKRCLTSIPSIFWIQQFTHLKMGQFWNHLREVWKFYDLWGSDKIRPQLGKDLTVRNIKCMVVNVSRNWNNRKSWVLHQEIVVCQTLLDTLDIRGCFFS